MNSLDKALLVDATGRPLNQPHKTQSNDWEEVSEFCNKVYMPYTVIPLKKLSKPNAIMHSVKVGQIIVTRFSYGAPIHLKDFSPEAGNIIVLTTIQGYLRHMVDEHSSAITKPGQSFVADCSRTDFWLKGDHTHLQLNLTIPHKLMEETALKWYGFIPNHELWESKIKFGGTGTSWLALMEYLVNSISSLQDPLRENRLYVHLEELICHELLRNWARGSGVNLDEGARSAAPYYVRTAENYMETYAKDVPSLGEVALASGVSVRALTGAFKRFRGITPGQFLRERRLEGVRASLLSALPGETVTQIASEWGYVNFGIFAKVYRERFGENPSHTLGRATKINL